LGQQSTIFPTAPKGLLYPGDPGCYNTGQATTHYDEFGPRIGFAWAPNLGLLSEGNAKKLSIRGGFGIYYNRNEEESSLETLSTPPFGISSSGAVGFGASAPGFANPYQDLNTGLQVAGNQFPYTFPVKGQKIDYSNIEPLFGFSSYDRTFRAPYAENFQLSVEREFPSSVIARLSYVGTLGRRNQIAYEGNYETAAGHAACLADTTNCVPDRNNQSLDFPSHTIAGAIDPNTGHVGFTSIGEVGSESSSSYHSLQASVLKGPTHGLTFQLSYTYGHALDNGSSYENSGFGSNGTRGYNQFVPSLNYGDSSFDARHRFIFAPIYIVPYRTSASPFSARNLALSGWEVSGILTAATGFPYDISYAGTTSRSLWCSLNFSFYACPDIPLQTAPLVRSNRLRDMVQWEQFRCRANRQLRKCSPQPLPRSRTQQHQPRPGKELYNLRGAGYAPTTTHGERQRFQSHTIQQPYQHLRKYQLRFSHGGCKRTPDTACGKVHLLVGGTGSKECIACQPLGAPFDSRFLRIVWGSPDALGTIFALSKHLCHPTRFDQHRSKRMGHPFISSTDTFQCHQSCLAIEAIDRVPPSPMVSTADEGTITIDPFSRIAS
jgi:hypothetical protein